QVNGDPRRSVFVGTAFDTLVSWYQLLRPGLRRPVPRHARSAAESMTRLAELLLRPFLALLALFVKWIAIGLLHLIWRAGQRAEYLADDLSARVAGAPAAISWLERSTLQDVFLQVVHGTTRTRQNAPPMFDDLRRRVLE